jgi:hypothetical protein
VDETHPKRSWIWGIVVVCVLGGLFTGTVGFFRLHNATALTIFMQSVSKRSSPVEQALVFRRVSAGMPEADFERDFPPINKRALGRFVTFNYGDYDGGTVVVAVGGKLVSARSYRDISEHDYFDTLTPTERKELKDAYAAYHESRQRARLQTVDFAKPESISTNLFLTATNLQSNASNGSPGR